MALAPTAFDLEEEERRRREEEERARLAAAGQPAAPVAPVAPEPDEVVRTQSVETRADGTQTVTTEQEVPAPQPQQQASAMQPVRDFVNQERAALNLPPVAPVAPTAAETSRVEDTLARLRREGAGQPAAPVAPAPVAPVAQPQMEERVIGADGRVRTVPPTARQAAAQVQAGAAPVATETDYDRSIRVQESGSNPNIGYHYPANAEGRRASTAYGAYGITAAAYRDIQRADPYFANRDITSLTPAEQTRANQVFTSQQARYLRSYGVEPTPNNLAAAHFLGARGLSNYLRDGSISPEAAAANGGYDAVRQIVDRRLAGQPAPASGALLEAAQTVGSLPPGVRPTVPTTAEQPQTPPPNRAAAAAEDPNRAGLERLAGAQGNIGALDEIRRDESLPEPIRRRASESIVNLAVAQQGQVRAQQAIANGDTRAIGQALSRPGRTQEGSAFRAAILQFLGLGKAAEEEINRWGGYGNRTQISQNSEGQSAAIDYDSQGNPLGGITADGRRLSATEAIAFAGGDERVQTSGTFFQTPDGQLLRAQVTERGGRPRLVDAATGARFTGDTRGLVKLEEAGGFRRMDRQLVVDLARRHGNNVLDAERDYVALNGPFRNENERAAFRQAYGFSGAQPAPVPGVPQIGGGAAPQPQAAPQAAPAAAPQAQAPVAPVAPVAPQAGAPAAPVAPVAPQAPAPAAITQPLAAQRGAQEASAAAQRAEAEAFIRYDSENIGPKAASGGTIARIRREQINGPDGILNNPEIVGMLSGQGGAGREVLNIIRDTVAGNFTNVDDLSSRIARLNLTQRQKDVLNYQIGLATQILPQTLKENAGAGAVSDAEQRANRAANVDIERQPLYSALTLMTRNQFESDLNSARGAFRAARPELATRREFDNAWSQERARLQTQYNNIYGARAAYIARYNPDGRNTNAVVEAYRLYPVPQWNSERQSWEFGTPYAERAAQRPPLSSFNR